MMKGHEESENATGRDVYIAINRLINLSKVDEQIALASVGEFPEVIAPMDSAFFSVLSTRVAEELSSQIFTASTIAILLVEMCKADAVIYEEAGRGIIVRLYERLSLASRVLLDQLNGCLDRVSALYSSKDSGTARILTDALILA